MDVDILRYLADLREEQTRWINERFEAQDRAMQVAKEDAHEARVASESVARERRDTSQHVIGWIMHVIALLISSLSLYLASKVR